MNKVKTFFSKIFNKIKSFFKNFNFKSFVHENMQTLISIVGLIIVVVYFTIASNGQIWSQRTVKYMVSDLAPYMVLALGAAFIYSMGYMDVSLGAQYGVFGILTIYTLNKTGSLLLGLLLSASIALVCGLLNGTVAVALKLPSIVTSIFLSSIFGGLQLLLVQSLTITDDHPFGESVIKADRTYRDMLKSLTDTKVIILIIIAFVILCCFLFYFTKIGKYVKSIGANETTTAQCGVNTTLYKTIGYAVLAVALAIAAVLLFVPSFKQASKDDGQGLAMNVMLCLILGGMPLSGGMKSKISCAIIGSLIFVLLNWGLNICYSDLGSVKYIINAIVFLLIVSLTSRQKGQLLPR